MLKAYLVIFIFLFSTLADARKKKSRKPTWRVKTNAELGFQATAFEKDKVDSNLDQVLSNDLLFTLKARKRRQRIKLDLFAANYASDSGSSHLIAKDAWYGYKGRSWYFKAGVINYSWSSLEVFNSFDVVNSLALLSDEKIGEPQISFEKNWRSMKLLSFIQPRLTDPIFPSSKSRFIGIGLGETIWVSKDDESLANDRALHFGLKFDHSTSLLDYSLLLYKGMDKSTFIIDFASFAPVYFESFMFGVNSQLPALGFVFKLDFLNKTYSAEYNGISVPDHSLVSIGAEKTFTFDSGKELSLILEIQNAFGLSSEEADSTYIFQNDIFIGTRFLWNDFSSSEFTGGVVTDLSRENELFLRFEYSRRVGSRWKFESNLEIVLAEQKDALPQGLEYLDGRNFIQTKIIRYF